MTELIFATANPHKLLEVKQVLPENFQVRSMAEIGITDEIEESGTSLYENALIKAQYVHERCNGNVFAEDTGLEVKALNGAPGVYSARYAGPGHDAEANLQKLLREMEGVTDRSARFRTVIALILNKKIHRFEGIVNGRIGEIPKGKRGFGYDPVFIPDGYNATFAELGEEVKNKISHRARAMKKMISYLNSLDIQP